MAVRQRERARWRRALERPLPPPRDVARIAHLAGRIRHGRDAERLTRHVDGSLGELAQHVLVFVLVIVLIVIPTKTSQVSTGAPVAQRR